MPGLYNADGQIILTVVDGSVYTGLYSPDGNWNVVVNDGSTYRGRMHPCGALNGVVVTDPSAPAMAANGSINIISNSFGGYSPLPLGSAQFALPSGFNWPQTTYPVKFGYNGTKYTSTFNPLSYATAAFAGTKYFVNGTTGSDANTGLSLGQAVKSIHRATTLGNATGAPFNVEVAYIADGYPRENGFSNTSTPVPNTQPAAYVSTGGTSECWVGSVLSWPGSPDVTFPNTYKVARGAVSRVINRTVLDVNGDYAELVKVADATACDATPNSWAQVAGDLYVHRTGEEAVTNTNTRVVLQATPNFQINATSKDVYVSGFAFQGGAAGAVVNCAAAATLNAMFVDCSAKYAGDAANNVNCFRLDFVTGLVALVRCTAACGVADGINTHWTPGGTPGIYTLTIDCIGRNNGVVGTVQSCNGLTSHDGCIGIDVNGEYYGNYGANVIPINTCQAFCLGTYGHDSVGDVSHGGTTTPTDFQTQNTAVMWLQNTRSAVSATSLLASNSSIIRKRNHSQGGGQSEGAGGGTITTF